MSKDDDTRSRYDVGYGKPPVAHRFQKGRSGNPSGSKLKRSGGREKSLSAELRAELAQTIAITEAGRRRRVPRLRALIKKLIAAALAGDPKARDQLLRLASRPDMNSEAAAGEDLVGAAKDAEILACFRAEIIRKHEAQKDE